MNQKEIADRPVVSFCIATFQRYEILEELIREILSVQTEKMEVVVSDDRSLDGSIEKIKEIKDNRLKIYVNEKNVGSSLNIHDSLDRGSGRYLFYVNDRDNVDSFKIEKLIEILEELEKEEVAFAQCDNWIGDTEKYRIFHEGKESLLMFACRIAHPTGYIFKRDVWKRIRGRRRFFEKQNYGDYPITMIGSIMARKYKGALIYGDICDLKRHRMDFTVMKSGYYKKRKDKRLWYTPEVIFREIEIGQKFLKKLGVQKDIREQILVDRYIDYLPWCVTKYKDMIKDPACTAHYNFYPHQDFLHVFVTSISNGIKLWSKIVLLSASENKQLISKINEASQREFKRYFESVLEDYLHVKGKLKEKDCEIAKREVVLNTYESWVDALISKKKISEYLLKNGYHHVAIYGMGRIGRHLWKEFLSSDVCVDYIIDQKISKYSKYYEGVPCFAIESELPRVDIIIVTVSGKDEIIHELRKKVKWTIRSINDILFVLK